MEKDVNKPLVNNKKLGGITGKGFMPGKSGNPDGRPPKEATLISCIKAELEKVEVNGQTKEQMIASILVKMASQGNLKAIDLLMTYSVAKPTASIEIKEEKEPVFVRLIQQWREEAGHPLALEEGAGG